ncbi:response regulator transcription factor [Carboxylicivirga sp. RSCT41]|uniref:response regulator transcription factor n=1 Tax=Carboxylicivirga agarovorans TaxID=3417570 RepID=UPI003D34B754
MQQLAISVSNPQWNQLKSGALSIVPQQHIVVINKMGNNLFSSDLESEFAIVKAYSNQHGIENTLAILPKLVLFASYRVTDEDTYLVQNLRDNPLTAHIPVVFITSEISNQQQINCLQAGVDAVFQMTIDKDVLNAQLKALINSREHLRAVYKQNQALVNGMHSDSLDRLFIKRARQIVLENYTNCSFNIDEFVKLMNVSRTMLYVKIKSLTDKTTSEFVRDIRLEEAARLLKEGLLNVSEVAFEVGFKDPKYLSKKFKQKFGITPALFRKGEV